MKGKLVWVRMPVIALAIGLIGAGGLSAQSSGKGGDVYFGIISFNQIAEDLTGGKPILMDRGQQDRLTSIFAQYNNEKVDQGTSLYYAVHMAIENLKANAATLPSNIKTVNIVTFTDGLDNNSTSPTLPSLGSRNFQGGRLPVYQGYVKDLLATQKINGVPITAYAYGFQGDDVFDESAFSTSLVNIASPGKREDGEDYWKKLNSPNELNGLFDTLSKNLYEELKNTTFTMITPSFPVGTKVRMTFDKSDNNPRSAETSTKYFEGEILGFSDGQFQLGNIKYAGISSDSGDTVSGKLERLVTYRFEGIKGVDFDTFDKKYLKQWTMAEGSRVWQVNSEYTPDDKTTSSEVSYSTIIYLVLDSSNSMKKTDMDIVRVAATRFVQNLTQVDVPPVQPRLVPRAETPKPATLGAWNRKWLYAGGFLGGGIYSYSSAFEKADSYGSYHETTETGFIPVVLGGAQVQFALLPFLSLEFNAGVISDLGAVDDDLGILPVAPLMVNLGGKFNFGLELSANAGYTLNAPNSGVTLGSTIGFHLGPGILFAEVFCLPFDNFLTAGGIGYKAGIGNK